MFDTLSCCHGLMVILNDFGVDILCAAVLGGSHSHNMLKGTNKCGNTAKTGLEANAGQRHFCLHQLTAVIDSTLKDIFRHGDFFVFLEQAGDVLAGVECVRGNISNGIDFGKVFVNIVLNFQQGGGEKFIRRALFLDGLIEQIKNLQYVGQNQRVVIPIVLLGVFF